MAPSNKEIFELFSHMGTGDYDKFFSSVSPNVQWTVMGTSPMSKTYTTLADFQKETLGRLRNIIKDPGLMIKVQHVIGGGKDSEWASVEMKADAECVDGQPYNMTYNWVCKFDDKGMIVQVRAYLDSFLLTKVLREHEAPVSHADVLLYS